ncbi:MAG TPA: hypothetical protein VNZ66_01775 [Aeromicrobium sp.]|nr:hypothetical protein [Aeromicrobium sp.]
MSLVRVFPALVAAVFLSACSSVHPGAAAVVDDTTISMSTLDEQAEVMCLIQTASQQQSGTPDNAAIRQNTISMLVFEQIAQSMIDDQQLTVDRELAALPDDARERIEAVFGDRADEVADLLSSQQLLYAQFVAIGAAVTGQQASPQTYDQLAAAGQQAAQEQLAELDVEFAPRLGIAPDGSALDGFGSVSVVAADLAGGPSQLTPLAACTA